LTELGPLLAGAPALDVAGLFPRGQVRRVPVPTYRFDQQRCWPALLGPADSVPDGRPPAAVPAGSPRPVLLRAFESALGLPPDSLAGSADLADFSCDSLEATGLKSRLEEALDVEVPIRLLIHEPSLTAVLERVEEHVLAVGRTGDQ
jgi:hypothetical protein